ncbi:hypothetical protein Y032_0286g1401 [Ancylostoma ceylanicum]|nr:hypothetical protein Y032_0286g1401 [Ancylostoma ceylanicum]
MKGSKVVQGLYPRECELCFPRLEFHDQAQFARHLRVVHSTKEGGSYICRYGNNNVCQKLPLEGVSDDDYEAHVRRVHCVPLQQSRLSVEDPHEKEFTLTRSCTVALLSSFLCVASTFLVLILLDFECMEEHATKNEIIYIWVISLGSLVTNIVFVLSTIFLTESSHSQDIGCPHNPGGIFFYVKPPPPYSES